MHVEVEKAGAFFHIIYLIFLSGKTMGSQRGEVCVLPGCTLPLVGKITYTPENEL